MVRVPTGGFSIALPSSWVNVTSASPTVLKKLEQVPAFKAFAQSASQNGSLKLIAADPSSNGSAYMDTGVARVGSVPLAAVASATVKALKQTLGKGGAVTSEKVKLAAGPAYALHLSRKGSPNKTDEYLFVRDQVEYVIVFVATSKSWPSYAPLFEKSAQSFRLTPGPDLSKIVLGGSQVGAGYKLTTFPFGNSFIGEPTLDLCGASYSSETLRTGRLQVRYARPGSRSPSRTRSSPTQVQAPSRRWRRWRASRRRAHASPSCSAPERSPRPTRSRRSPIRSCPPARWS